MIVAAFFVFCGLVFIAGLVLVALSVQHHIKLWRAKSKNSPAKALATK